MYMCVQVSLCECLFEFTNVFFIVKLVCRLSRRRFYVIQIKCVLIGRLV